MADGKERDFKGVWIPKEIWLDKDLTMIEKLFLVEIDNLSKLEKGCIASNSHFSEFFDLSKGRCTQVVKSLESKGYLKIALIREKGIIKERRLGVVNKLNRVFRKLNGGSEKTKRGYLENAEGNNTNHNNTKEKGNKDTGASDLPDGLNPDAWNAYLEHRKTNKPKDFTPRAMTLAQNILLKMSNRDQQLSVDKSILNGWTGIFPPDEPKKASQSTHESFKDKDYGQTQDPAWL